jgi:hypothetical protein
VRDGTSRPNAEESFPNRISQRSRYGARAFDLAGQRFTKGLRLGKDLDWTEPLREPWALKVAASMSGRAECGVRRYGGLNV